MKGRDFCVHKILLRKWRTIQTMGEVIARHTSDKDLVLYKIYKDSYNSIKTKQPNLKLG